jgi:hypothetical protein
MKMPDRASSLIYVSLLAASLLAANIPRHAGGEQLSVPPDARPTRISFPVAPSERASAAWTPRSEPPRESLEIARRNVVSSEAAEDLEQHRSLDQQPWRVRLPMTGQRRTNLPPPPGWTAAEFASLGSSPESEPLVPGDEFTEETGRLSSHKDGFFQKYSISGAWLYPGNGDNELGLTELRTFLTVAVPLPSRDYPMLITPGFDATLFSGPESPDLPSQVYDAYLDFMWLPKLTDGWLGILSLAPGVYSDFEDLQSDAFRIKGKALIRYDWSPDRLQLVAGVLYLNRNDVNWLPAGGLIWTPSDTVNLEMVFPNRSSPTASRIRHTMKIGATSRVSLEAIPGRFVEHRVIST